MPVGLFPFRRSLYGRRFVITMMYRERGGVRQTGHKEKG